MKYTFLLAITFVWSSNTFATEKYLAEEFDEVKTQIENVRAQVEIVDTKNQADPGICYRVGNLGQKLENLSVAGIDLLVAFAELVLDDDSKDYDALAERVEGVTGDAADLIEYQTQIARFCVQGSNPKLYVGYLNRAELAAALKALSEDLIEYELKHFK